MINNINMVTDRSYSDIETVKELLKKGIGNMTDAEKQEFLSGLKGAYNASDFNRVESAVKYLANALCNAVDDINSVIEETKTATDVIYCMPYEKSVYQGVETKTNWAIGEIVYSADRQRYIDNIFLLLKSLSIPSIRIPEKMEGMDYNDANEIEISLEELNVALIKEKQKRIEYIENASKSFAFSGEVYGGEI